MIDILKINSNSTNGETDNTAKVLVMKLNEKNWSSDQTLDSIIKNIDENQKTLNKAIKRNRVESDLEVKDIARDKALRSLFSLVKSYAIIENELQPMALELQSLLDRYGLSATISANYANESSYINSMLEELGNDKYKEHISKLMYISGLIEDLKSAQTNFEESHQSYIDDMAVNKAKSSASSIKLKLVKIINDDLINYLQLMAKMKPEIYEELAVGVSEIIEDNNDRVRRRKSKKDDDDSSEDESGPIAVIENL
ncbi:MAG: DUF6261 family protein [Bacteroidales bacterium]